MTLQVATILTKVLTIGQAAKIIKNQNDRVCVCVWGGGGGGGGQFDPALSRLLGLIFAISKDALTLKAEESVLRLY